MAFLSVCTSPTDISEPVCVYLYLLNLLTLIIDVFQVARREGQDLIVMMVVILLLLGAGSSLIHRAGIVSPLKAIRR